MRLSKWFGLCAVLLAVCSMLGCSVATYNLRCTTRTLDWTSAAGRVTADGYFTAEAVLDACGVPVKVQFVETPDEAPSICVSTVFGAPLCVPIESIAHD